MTSVFLKEYGRPLEVSVTMGQGLALRESQLVFADPSLTPGRWLLRARSYVGVATVAGVELWIEPKVKIDRLLFLMGYALSPRGWRDEDIDLVEEDDLLPALAFAFERQARRATEQGLLQGYRLTEDSLPVLRGRLREQEQMSRRFGLAVPLEVRYDEFTVDIPENQLLLAAARVLLRLGRLHRSVRRGLLRLTADLGEVSLLVRGQALPQWYPNRLSARYHTALRLAELVLRASSVEQRSGVVRINGFLFDMNRVFEDFVTVALSEALSIYGGQSVRQDRLHLDIDDRVRIRPDLVWYNESGRPSAVADAKYKAERPQAFGDGTGYPEQDLYQMLAYCTALNLRRGHLVYAKGNEPSAAHVVRHSGIEIVQHGLDLAQSPTRLLDQIGAIARALAGEELNVGV